MVSGFWLITATTAAAKPLTSCCGFFAAADMLSAPGIERIALVRPFQDAQASLSNRVELPYQSNSPARRAAAETDKPVFANYFFSALYPVHTKSG